MKTPLSLPAVILAAVLTSACGDISTSSGGGGSAKSSINVTGTWSGTVSGIADDFKTTATYPVTVRLEQHGDVLVGSVHIPECFPESPITSGSVRPLKGTDLTYISFKATGPGREFSFGFGEVSRQGAADVMDGLAGMTTSVPGCLSFGFALGTATLERTL